jgi:hypothetical protein
MAKTPILFDDSESSERGTEHPRLESLSGLVCYVSICYHTVILSRQTTPGCRIYPLLRGS